MEKRLIKHKGVLPEWHWLFTVQVFTSDLATKQVHWKGQTFNIRPWEVCDLPIGFGFRKGSNKTIFFVNGKEEEVSSGITELKQLCLENIHL